MIVNLKASEIAALIGCNRYYDCTELKKYYIDKLLGLKQSNKPYDYLVALLHRKMPKDVHKIISRCKERVPDKASDIAVIIEEYKNEFKGYPFDIRRAIEYYVKFRLNTEWGSKNEQKSIDAVKRDYSDFVDKININKFYCEFDGIKFNIFGELDGYLTESDCVIEIKNRTNKKFVANIHDFIQIRVYMYLKEAKNGMLIEDYDDMGYKSTNIIDDERCSWEYINSKLIEVCKEISAGIRGTYAVQLALK